MVKASEKEFLFGAREFLFLGMSRFRFLFEASRKTVAFAFIYFIFLCYSFFIYHVIPTSTLRKNMKAMIGKKSMYNDVMVIYYEFLKRMGRGQKKMNSKKKTRK